MRLKFWRRGGQVEVVVTKYDDVDAKARWSAWNQFVNRADKRPWNDTIPHCDSRILHAPDECTYCDRPRWQRARKRFGIANTGHQPAVGEVPCEADATRGPESGVADHRRWGGNKPTSAVGNPEWPEETGVSRAFYGDMGGRS